MNRTDIIRLKGDGSRENRLCPKAAILLSQPDAGFRQAFRRKGKGGGFQYLGQFKAYVLIPDLNIQRFFPRTDQIPKPSGAASIGVSIGKKSRKGEAKKEYP